MVESAVAMIVFNRVEPARRVLAAVAKARPAQLFVIADGARSGRPGEAERVAQVRALFDTIDWPCEVHRNFSPTNLGCEARVISGIDWVFEHVDAAVILEDDCLPAPAFFDYCDAMLATYRDEQRIFSVSGSNFLGTADAEGHYYSQMASLWGWATWRDRWANYVQRPDDAAVQIARVWGVRPLHRAYWRKIFAMLAAGKFDTWDYQWVLTHWRHNALCVKPTRNLIENIGFGADSTHTADASSWLARMSTYAGDAEFTAAPQLLAADTARDTVEARRLLQIGWKTVTAMYLPWLPVLWRRWRRR